MGKGGAFTVICRDDFINVLQAECTIVLLDSRKGLHERSKINGAFSSGVRVGASGEGRVTVPFPLESELVLAELLVASAAPVAASALLVSSMLAAATAVAKLYSKPASLLGCERVLVQLQWRPVIFLLEYE